MKKKKKTLIQSKNLESNQFSINVPLEEQRTEKNKRMKEKKTCLDHFFEKM